MPRTRLQNNSRLKCLEEIYRAKTEKSAKSNFSSLFLGTGIAKFTFFIGRLAGANLPIGEILCASEHAPADLIEGPPPQNWLLNVMRLQALEGRPGEGDATPGGRAEQPGPDLRVPDDTLHYLDAVDGRVAAALAFDLSVPGERGAFVALGEPGADVETLVHALSDWSWLIKVGGRLLVDRLQPSFGAGGGALSKAEASVIAGMAQGFSAAEIAHRTGRSMSTIRNQLRSAKEKLGARSTAEIVVIAIRTRQISI